eukprot:m51a1_g338 hypothetical protein (440) ;mRNA; f:520873-522341
MSKQFVAIALCIQTATLVASLNPPVHTWPLNNNVNAPFRWATVSANASHSFGANGLTLSDTYLNIDPLPVWGSEFTMAAWYKVDTAIPNAENPILCDWVGGMWSYLVEHRTNAQGTPEVFISIRTADNTEIVSYAVPSTTGEWHHVALTRVGQPSGTVVMNVLFDGVLRSSFPVTATVRQSPSTSHQIGFKADDSATLNGHIKSVAFYTSGFTTDQVVQLMTASLDNIEALPITPMRYWPLRESTVSSPFTPVFGPSGFISVGPTGSHLSNAYLSIPAEVVSAPEWTMAAWVRFDSFGDFNAIFGDWAANTWAFMVEAVRSTDNTAAVIAMVRDSNQRDLYPPSMRITRGNWHHVALAVDYNVANAITLFVNGTSAGSKSLNGALSLFWSGNAVNYIGLKADDTHAWEGSLNGWVHHVTFHDSALTSADVTRLMASTQL